MENRQTGWWKQDIGPRLLGLGLAGIALMLRYRQLPMMLEWAQTDALLNVCIVVWPLAMLPWLTGLPRKRQLWLLLGGAVIGYWAMGYPAIYFLHDVPLPNIVVLPRIAGAMAVGFSLLLFWDFLLTLRWANLVKWSVPVVGLCLVWLAVNPVNVADSLQPGELRPGQLAFEVTESYELQGGMAAAYTYGDVLVAIGQQEWLWRNPEGQGQVRPGNYDPRRVKVHCDGQRLVIVEPVQGRVECYRYPDGELLWMRDNLGEFLDVAWTAEYAWVLNCPDFDSGVLWPRPDDPQVVLHRLDLKDGKHVQVKVEPPDKRFWKHMSSGPLAWLEANEEQAWVAGWSSAEQPVYVAPNHYDASETAVQFLFRPAQGKLKQLSLLLPDGLPIHHDYHSPMSYYLQDDMVIDVMLTQTEDGADYVARGRSLRTGEQIWVQKLAPVLFGQTQQEPFPFRAGNKLLVDTGSKLLCLDEQSGEPIWSYARPSRLRWVVPVDEDDVVFGLANGLVIRVGAEGEQVWQYSAFGFTDLDGVDESADAVIIRESGVTASAESVALLGSYGGSYTALSLDDGSKLPLDGPWLDTDKFAVAGEFVWHMKQFTYKPGPYNGDKAIYRLSGRSTVLRDLQALREDILVRPDFLLVAEQAGTKTRLIMLRVKE